MDGRIGTVDCVRQAENKGREARSKLPGSLKGCSFCGCSARRQGLTYFFFCTGTSIAHGHRPVSSSKNVTNSLWASLSDCHALMKRHLRRHNAPVCKGRSQPISHPDPIVFPPQADFTVLLSVMCL